MQLSSPKMVTWVIALIILLVAVVGALGVGGAIATYAVWIAIVGLALMLAATMMNGL